MALNDLQKKNPDINIVDISDDSFLKYGTILKEYDFTSLLHIMKSKGIPTEGNTYIGNDADLYASSITNELQNNFYGHMPIQIGYCNGHNTKLNALEYHKCVEIDVAVTDLVLLLCDIRKIKQNQLSSSLVVAYYVPAGTALQLYGTTLHFSPCALSKEGFKSIIILAAGTNEALTSFPEKKEPEDELLWMKNKWLIAHKDSVPASKGAYVGITGNNLEIFYE